MLDDMYYGASSKSVFDGVGYIQVADGHPTAPASLDTLSTSGGNLSLQWLDLSSTETSYIVQRKVGAAPFTVLATLPAGAVAYTDSSVMNGSYVYRVACFADSCKSVYSNQLPVHVEGSGSGARLAGQTTVMVTTTIARKLNVAHDNAVSIYPNPSDGIFLIETANLPAARYTLRVSDLNGRTVLAKQLNVSGKSQAVVDLTSRSRGIYIVQMVDQRRGNTFRARIVRN